MLKYLIVLLKDQSAPICQYNISDMRNGLVSLANLNSAIMFGLKHNLIFQFVMPYDVIPDEYNRVINKVEHVKYVPCSENEIRIKGCVKVSDNHNSSRKIILVPLSIIASFTSVEAELKKLIQQGYQISIIRKDVESATSHDFINYEKFLNNMVAFLLEIKFDKNDSPFNILTDRLYLRSMNNCNAGISSITFAPDGKFYLCPAYYFNGDSPLKMEGSNIVIPNQHLLDIKNAPICSNCDAFQCNRCIFLNQQGTREVNTPTRNQCIVSHIERNASRRLASNISWINEDEIVPKIEYLDPFEITVKK